MGLTIFFFGLLVLFIGGNIWWVYHDNNRTEDNPVTMAMNDGHVFTVDPHNPFRRFCHVCGQTQVQIEYRGMRYWEEQGKVVDDCCGCHNHSRYYT